MDFSVVSFVVDVEMRSFCLLTSWSCSFLYLHSNDMNNLKSLFLKKKKKVRKYNCYKKQMKSVHNREGGNEVSV